MPIYDFICAYCHKTCEKLLSRFDADKKQTCEVCGVGALERQVSTSSFILRGKGWPGKDISRGGKDDG